MSDGPHEDSPLKAFCSCGWQVSGTSTSALVLGLANHSRWVHVLIPAEDRRIAHEADTQAATPSLVN